MHATYTYDAYDNIVTADMTSPARQYRYNYDAVTNRLTSIKTLTGATTFAFGYDVYGNVASKGAQGYTFDIANRLTAVNGLQSYRYDGQGRRVQTTDANNAVELWIYSQAGQVLYTSEARRSQNIDYIYLGNTQVATRYMDLGHHHDVCGCEIRAHRFARQPGGRNQWHRHDDDPQALLLCALWRGLEHLSSTAPAIPGM